MEPYERSELGGVGERLGVIEGAQPLTQLQLGSKLPSFRNPWSLSDQSGGLVPPRPLERGKFTQSLSHPQPVCSPLSRDSARRVRFRWER
jgi:hypothetical protein